MLYWKRTPPAHETLAAFASALRGGDDGAPTQPATPAEMRAFVDQVNAKRGQ